MGSGSKSPYRSYLSLTQSRWILLIYNAIRLNVIATWDSHCCASPLAAKLIAIQKAYMVSDNFPRWKIQVENDCKTTVEVLLGLATCPWKSVSVF